MDASSLALALLAVVLGLAVLVWSADRFVEGAAALARLFGMSPLLIGMVIVGFGTSVPEMIVSAFAALDGNPEIALGNAYGSNITNIALILGISALMRPIAVASRVVRLEMPILLGVTAFAGLELYTGDLTRLDAVMLLVVFALLMGWSIWQNARKRPDTLEEEIDKEFSQSRMTTVQAGAWTVVGLLLLIVSSRALVWGAVEIATALGVSNLVIGLTVVALGTSLPELASSLAAARKNEYDIALGNILGSNLFNTLAVVGIAGVISPLRIPADVLTRDYPVMAGVTLLLFLFVYGFRGPGRITRVEGGVLLGIFVLYSVYLVFTATA
ncbi:MAG: calcium/sodium antiporter [Bacteroidetes bacterium]|nr:calcium/sodium antiporter [Bacteroidota bacterium]